MKNSEYAPTTRIAAACWCLSKNLWAKTYGKWESMRSSAASGCKCTADTAHWVIDAAAGSCFFVKRKRDNARGPEGGWLLKTSRWLLIQTTIYGDGTQPSRSTIPISLDRKPENNNKQNTHKNIVTSLCFRKILRTFNMSSHSPHSIGITRQLWDGHFRYLRVNRKKALLQTDVQIYLSKQPNHQFLSFPTTGQEC